MANETKLMQPRYNEVMGYWYIGDYGITIADNFETEQQAYDWLVVNYPEHYLEGKA